MHFLRNRQEVTINYFKMHKKYSVYALSARLRAKCPILAVKYDKNKILKKITFYAYI